MPATPNDPTRFGTIELRVRYAECDPMGVAHHTAYPVWFEMGRTELCRAGGTPYQVLEERGILLAVTRLDIRYRAPARYDDLLKLETTRSRVTRARLEHTYALIRDGLRLAEASTVLACLDRDGTPRPIPDELGLG